MEQHVEQVAAAPHPSLRRQHQQHPSLAATACTGTAPHTLQHGSASPVAKHLPSCAAQAARPWASCGSGRHLGRQRR